MKLQVLGHDVYVKFFHGQDSTGRWTEVAIESGYFPEGKIVGITYCHPADQYSRKKGRIQSLNSAFFGYPKPWGGTREPRKVYREFTAPFWEQYFLKQPNDKR